MLQNRYLFRCPNCSEEIIVDKPIKEDFLDKGCIVCQEQVEKSDFKPKN